MPTDSLQSTARTLDRRSFLQLGIAGATALLWPHTAAFAKASTYYQKLRVRFRTDPERIARMLPPGLAPDESTEAWIEYTRVTPESAGPLFAKPYTVAAFGLAVRHKDQPAWFQPLRWTDHDWLRTWEREQLGLNTKHAEIDLTLEGAAITASLARKGFRLHRVETVRTDETAEPSAARDTLTYDYSVNPNWQKGLSADNLGLWSIPAATAPDGTQIRACDLPGTKLATQHPSPLDPITEFPALEIIEATYQDGTAHPGPFSASRKPRLVTGIDSAAFKPSSLINFDRPHTKRRPWQPEGWPNEATAFKLSAPEIERYQSRQEVRVGPFDMLDVRLTTDGDFKDDLLPMPARSGMRPALRILVMRVDESDLSPIPFTESWLFAFGAVGNERGWFALSHIVSEGADLTFGRDVYGYPSKLGLSELVLSPFDFSARCVRNGREFFNARGELRGVPTGTSLSQLPVLGLRRTRSASGEPTGEIVSQPWFFQGRHYTVDRTSVEVSLPEPNGDGPATDPWFEFNPVRIAAISVMTNGTMQRSPGQVIAPVPNFEPHYRERCDGVIPGIDEPGSPSTPTFGVSRGPVTRS